MGVDVKILREIKEKCPKCGKGLIFEKNSTRSEDRLKCLCGWSITRGEAEKMKKPDGESALTDMGQKKCSKCGEKKTKPDLLITRSPEQIIRMLQHGTALELAKDLRALADQLERKFV